MKKLINSKLLLQVIVASMVATLATAGIVGAATTIGSNINTGGTLTATGATTIYGATSIGGALTATSTLAVTGVSTLTGNLILSTASSTGLVKVDSLQLGTVAITPTGTELNYVDGVTSAIQTQMNLKSPLASPTFTGTATFVNASSTGWLKTATINSDTGAISFGDENLTTTGTLASGALTVTGATILSSTLDVTGITTLGNNVTVPAAYSLDTAAAGQLNIGTSTATAIRIGSSGMTTTVAGALTVSGATTLSNNITVPAAYGLDTAGSGALNIGTTTATSINIGRAGVPAVIANASSTLANFGGGTTIGNIVFGTCTVTIGTVTASSTAVADCAATGVTTDHKVFVTPYITDPNIIFTSASSTGTNTIQVSVYNTGWVDGVPGTNDDPANNTWSWMAIK